MELSPSRFGEMKIMKPIIQGIIHILLWAVGIILMLVIMSHSQSRFAYGYITGWWLSLYVGYIFRFKISSAITALLIYIIIGIASLFFKWNWFYTGLPDIISLNYIAILCIGGLFVASPIVINSVVRKLSTSK